MSVEEALQDKPKHEQNRARPAPGQGVRKITLKDQAPDCEMVINGPAYRLEEVAAGKSVVDIGCGYGRNKAMVEGVGGTWTGVEPFEGGAHTVRGDAENLPFPEGSFDVAVMDAVLEHVPDVGRAFEETARVLRRGGLFVGYVAFMECFHEISYSHLSYKALEHYAALNGMKLEKVSGGSAFGIDYHLNVILFPLPFRWGRKAVAACIRGIFRLKSRLAYLGLRYRRKMPAEEARETAALYYKVECLRQSNGFGFVIRKLP